YPAPKSDGATEQPAEGRVQLTQDGALDTDADRLHRLTLTFAVNDQGPGELLGSLVGRAEAAQGEHFPRLVHGRYLTRGALLMIRAPAPARPPARAAMSDEPGLAVPRRSPRAAYEPTLTADGGVEHDPNVVLAAVATCLDAVLAGPGLPDVAGVGVATFWHGLLGFDATGHAVTPIYMWADTRSAREATLLASALDEAALHARTGCHVHTSYWPAKLRWLARERPVEAQRVARWGSIGEHLERSFFGEAATSVSIASATGLFDQASLTW